jgi:hypothetical protein
MVLNSLDNFLDGEGDGDGYNDGGVEGNELSKNVVSTEGCFACDMNKKGQPAQLSRQQVTTSGKNSYSHFLPRMLTV